MDINLRPQWRLWNFPRQRPVCGKCGILHTCNRICYANFKTCFKCGRMGHYARMLFARVPVKTKENLTSIQKTKVKSKRRPIPMDSTYEQKTANVRIVIFNNKKTSLRKCYRNK